MVLVPAKRLRSGQLGVSFHVTPLRSGPLRSIQFAGLKLKQRFKSTRIMGGCRSGVLIGESTAKVNPHAIPLFTQSQEPMISATFQPVGATSS